MTLFKNLITISVMILMLFGPANASELSSPNLEVMMNPELATELVAHSPYKLHKNEIMLNEASIKVDAINPTVFSNKTGNYLPGARGTNQLVVYTSLGSLPRTGTNEFGAEAIVEGSTVTELSGADSIIPVNGMVISGHGRAKSWIVKNIKIGTKIYLDLSTKTLYAYTTSESYLFEADKKITEAKNMLDFYKMRSANYDFKLPSYYIKEAMDYLKMAEKDTANIKEYSHLAIESANTALKSVIPYENKEFKGVWVRPNELSKQEIMASVKRIKAAGIENIFLETYYHGRTIFPSKTMEKYGFVEQNERFDGIDPLKLWIRYAHRNGIKVHVWFETFYVGIQKPEANPNNILAVQPTWANKTKRNYNINAPTPSASEHNGFFVDPANPEVQEFLLELITEIVDDYNIDGINLDYIRYPQSVSVSDMNAWGYTEFARNEFKTIYGKDPIELTAKDPLWLKWCEYRREKVSNFVAIVGELGRKTRTYVSAVIFPDRLSALTTKQQDWKTWSTKGYINGFTPLFLTCNAKTLNVLVSNVMNAKSPNTDLFAGLFVTFMGGSEEDLIREIHETRKINIQGVILFDYAHLDNKYVKTLATRVFNENHKNLDDIEAESVRLPRIEGSATPVISKSEVKQEVKARRRRFWRR